jgi:hypothetical protein
MLGVPVRVPQKNSRGADAWVLLPRWAHMSFKEKRGHRPFPSPSLERRRGWPEAAGVWPAGVVPTASNGKGACRDSGAPDEGLGVAGGSPWWPGHEHQRSVTSAFGCRPAPAMMATKKEASWLACYCALPQEIFARPVVA